MKTYTIAVIPGDGIGPEVTREGIKVLEAAGQRYGIRFRWQDYPFGADYYLDTGKVIEDSDLDEIAKTDAIYLGALGDPRVPERVLIGGILLRLRFHFDQYVNLRPIKLLRGVDTPLTGKTADDINFYVIRENSEDFYIGLGGRMKGARGAKTLELKRRLYNARFHMNMELAGDEEMAYQLGVITRKGALRVIKYAFELAKAKGLNRLVSVDKANVLTDIYGFWREILDEVAQGYPGISYESHYVDATTMWFVKKPEWYQVVVAPNMFGDIITDLGAMIQGGMGLAPGGNINPDGGVSMFEPIHGSAPKYKGQNVANPIAAILAGQMMMEHLGENEAGAAIERAVETLLVERRVRPRDLGGTSGTSEIGDEVARIILEGR